MDNAQLCKSVLDSDDSIRFTGIVNDKAELIAGGNRENITPILKDEEIGMSVHYTLQRWRKAQNFEYRFGKEKSSVTEYENVTLITLPFEKNLFLISTEPGAKYPEIIATAISLMKN